MRTTMLGLLFLGALGLLTYYTIFLSSFDFGAGQALSMELPDGVGLKPGDAVLVSGTRLGRVSEVLFRDRADLQRRILVRMNLEQKITIYADYRARVEASTLLGGRVVSLDPGGPPAPALTDLNAPLSGRVQPDVLDAMAAVFSDNRRQLHEGIATLNEALEAARDILVATRAGKGSVGRFLRDEKFYEQALGLLEEMRSIAESFSSPDNSLGRLLTSDELYDEVLAIAGDLREVVGGLRAGKGSIGILLKDSRLIEDLMASAADLRAFTSAVDTQRGLLGALAYDARLKHNVQNTAADLDKITASIANEESLAGKLLVGDRGVKKVLEPIEQILADLASGARNLREGRGIMGMLFNDEESALRLRNLIRNFGRATEDAREAAPISTLVGVLTLAL